MIMSPDQIDQLKQILGTNMAGAAGRVAPPPAAGAAGAIQDGQGMGALASAIMKSLGGLSGMLRQPATAAPGAGVPMVPGGPLVRSAADPGAAAPADPTGGFMPGMMRRYLGGL